MDVEKLLAAAADYGFPMLVSWYLLVRMEAKLDRLSENIGELARTIAAAR